MENSFLGWLVVVLAIAVGTGVIALIAWGIHWFYRQGVERPAWVDGVWNAILRWSLLVSGVLVVALVAGDTMSPDPISLIVKGIAIGGALSAAALALFLGGLWVIPVEARHSWMRNIRGSPSILVFLWCFCCLSTLGVTVGFAPDNLQRLSLFTGAALGLTAALGLRLLIRSGTDKPLVYPSTPAPRKSPRPGGSGDTRAPRHARQRAITRRSRARTRGTSS